METMEKSLFAVIGGVIGGALTLFGAWLSDLRSEKRRKRAKLEEAYHKLLDGTVLAVHRLKAISELAEKQPESIDSHATLLEKMESLRSDLQGLISALNLAFLYESNWEKRELLESHVTVYELLAVRLGVIVAHHKTHINFESLIDRSDEIIKSATDKITTLETMRSKETDANPELKKRIAEEHRCAMHTREEANRVREYGRHHLTSCSANLVDDAKCLGNDIARIEQMTPRLRRIIALL